MGQLTEPFSYISMSRGRTVTGLSGVISHICVSKCSCSGGEIGKWEYSFEGDTWLVPGKKIVFLGFEILVMKLEGLN